jgi:hypothetical protein
LKENFSNERRFCGYWEAPAESHTKEMVAVWQVQESVIKQLLMK